MPEGIKIFAGNSNGNLANEIADVLDIPMGNATVSTFSDGENTVHIDENVRGSDVYVVQST